MAVQLNDATALITRVANLVQGNSDTCVCFWYQPLAQATSPDYMTAWGITDAGYTAWSGVFGNAGLSDGTHQLSASNGGAPTSGANSIISSGQIAHIGYRRFGTTHQFLHNGFIVGTITMDMSAVTFAEMLLGNDRFGLTVNARFWDYKEWSASNSVGTIRTEMANFGTVTSALGFLNCFTPLLNDLLDVSGNGNDWSGAGNFEFVANPALPQNVSPATATVITSLPFSETIGETYNLPLWYKRTPVAPESYIGGWGFGGLGSYEPAAFVWTGDGTQESPLDSAWQTVALNVPFETPLIPGQDFYFEFRSQFGQGFGNQLDVSFLAQPDEAIVPGASILVTDNSPGYGASIIDITDGHVQQFDYPDIPGGLENGAVLIDGNGRVLLGAVQPTYNDPELFLYEADLTPVLQVPLGADPVSTITSNLVDTFYLAYHSGGATDVVHRMDANGTIDLTDIGPIPDMGANVFISTMAVSPDNATLYYHRNGNDLGAIRTWDLINNIAGPEFLPSPGVGWIGFPLLMLPSGDFLGGFQQFSGGSTAYLRRYQPDGTVVWSFDMSAITFDYHGMKLAYGADYPDDFWIITHIVSGHSVYRHMDANTGTDIGDGFTVPTFSIGAYEPAESATPEARFGPAPSCFYLVLAEGVAPICPGLMGEPRIGL